MQIIIDIPEEQYITLNAKTQKDVIAVIDTQLLKKAITNGTPLDEIKFMNEQELRNKIAQEVADKMDYMNTCLNERNIILGIITGKREHNHSLCDECRIECLVHNETKAKQI